MSVCLCLLTIIFFYLPLCALLCMCPCPLSNYVNTSVHVFVSPCLYLFASIQSFHAVLANNILCNTANSGERILQYSKQQTMHFAIQ